MNLSGILEIIEELPAVGEVTRHPTKGGAEGAVTVLESAKPALLAAVGRLWQGPVLILTGAPERAKQIADELHVWLGQNDNVFLFPEPDALPYERIASDLSTVQQRLGALLALLRSRTAPGQTETSKPVIVASAHAAMMKTLAPKEVTAATHTIRRGDRLDLIRLAAEWIALGYEPVPTVEAPGQFSRRGGIADIYPPTSEYPARLEFFGDEIDSLRLFDPMTQRSVSLIEEFRYSTARETPPLESGAALDPLVEWTELGFDNEMFPEHATFEVRELLASARNHASILDHLPESSLIVIDELEKVMAEAERLVQQATELRAGQVERRQLPADFPVPYWTWPELAGQLGSFTHRIDLRYPLVENEDKTELAMPFHLVGAYGGRLRPLIRDLQRWTKEGRTVVVTSQQSRRLAELLHGAGTFVEPAESVSQPPEPGSLILLHGSLPEGFAIQAPRAENAAETRPARAATGPATAIRSNGQAVLSGPMAGRWPQAGGEETLDDEASVLAPGDLILLTDREIFGFIKPRRQLKRRAVARDTFLASLEPGDYVVHIEHGIGRFVGLTKMTLDEVEREYLVVNYAEGDRLYVPVDQLDRLNRYVGASEHIPALTRLGTQEWARAKERVRRSVHHIAKELLSLYAARELAPGFVFSADSVWQQEMEASFPYVETADQLAAIHDVKGDMESSRPMDRLLCGDVGYGKTEIAIRAAFKAVLDGKQVAVLVPTTVLAQQHFGTFRERIGAFPVNVEVLSRFRSEKEQRQVLEGLKEGTVDICIGTHRLIQKDVEFKNLGLLIVDEEQRFGVVHKEHLKNMRKEVDVLTLTATPIPRTLHMSLVGVRDLSTMETPPEERLPIKTYVTGYDDHLVREAILRELDRGGQVFFVHNRVHNIAHIATKLMELIPEAEIAVGHGQMPEDRLERVMLDFVNGRTDVLVCTTIIESGLDIPNANTIIVSQADRFGLAQLYQLRGRVGRGANRAYAYFLYDKNRRLTETAEKRLRTIFEASELGAGYRIAMKDLEIRGAGNLLGPEQSGHIAAVGFDLYTRMLADTVAEIRALRDRDGQVAARPRAPQAAEVTLDLPLSAFIPVDYVADDASRLEIYRRLVALTKLDDLEEMAQELRDRFGEAPEPARNLLSLLETKLWAARAGVQAINVQDSEVAVQMRGSRTLDRSAIAGAFPKGIKVGTTQIRLDMKRLGREWMKDLIALLRFLAERSPGVSQA